jgi:hypothetical protein
MDLVWLGTLEGFRCVTLQTVWGYGLEDLGRVRRIPRRGALQTDLVFQANAVVLGEPLEDRLADPVQQTLLGIDDTDRRDGVLLPLSARRDVGI